MRINNLLYLCSQIEITRVEKQCNKTLPVNSFKWDELSKFSGNVIKKYDRNSDIEYFLEFNIKY